MRIDFLQHNITRILSQRNGLLIVVGVLALSNVILSAGYLYKSEKIILVPPHIKKTVWIQGGEVSQSYLEEMGLYMVKLLHDLSPASFAYNHDTLLKYATPEAYGSLKKQLMEDGEQYIKFQLSTNFKPMEVTAYPEILEVVVKGTLASFVSGKHIHDSQETISLKFSLRGDGLLLERVTGGKPHEL
jgi:conjugal transfer pilus assembly protein TraE